MRNRFDDPAGNVASYDWQVNHSEEGDVGREPNIENGAPTSNVGMIVQEGADNPLVLRVRGTILHAAQHEEFLVWRRLSRAQTIYFTDFAGDSYEVIITRYVSTRHRTIRNPRDQANMPFYFRRYEMDMQVVRVIAGAWAGELP